MREIKFRAWDPISRQFCYVQLGSPQYAIDVQNIQEVIFNNRLIWQQYTGLKDKNGDTEIYEGDIVNKKYHNLSVYNGIGVVEMGTGSDSDGWSNCEWLGWKAGDSSLLDVADSCEVIGNIYENGDLLN